jgi:hypothetical protein
MTASPADRFVARLTPAAVEVLVVLCWHAPEVTYEGSKLTSRPSSASAVAGSVGS